MRSTTAADPHVARTDPGDHHVDSDGADAHDSQTEPPERILDLAEVCRRLSSPTKPMSRPTTYTFLDRPDGLPTIRLGRRRYVVEKELNAFIERLRQAGGWDTKRGCLLDGGAV